MDITGSIVPAVRCVKEGRGADGFEVGQWKHLEYDEDGRVELYNLKEDVGETKDLAAKMTDKADALLRGL